MEAAPKLSPLPRLHVQTPGASPTGITGLVRGNFTGVGDHGQAALGESEEAARGEASL